MRIYGKNAKICATCEFWVGKRYPKIGYVQIEQEKGSCHIVYTVTGFPRLCQEGCEKWKKWSVLR